MGGENACTSGESYHFATDGKLRIERCEDGQIAELSHSWQVQVVNEVDLQLLVDGAPYGLRFREQDGIMEMRLRKQVSEITEKTEDQIFRLSD